MAQCGLRSVFHWISTQSCLRSRLAAPQLAACHYQSSCDASSLKRQYSVFEPDDLVTEPEIPEYGVLSIRMRGYDYVTLESFAKFAHNIVKNMGLENDVYPVPARTCRVQNYKPFSTNIDQTYNLAMYERVVQVEDLPSTLAPILFEVLQQNSPEGVNIRVTEFDAEEEDFRYVPDIMLMELQAQVDELDKAKEDRRRK